jgi:hypothetical protein
MMDWMGLEKNSRDLEKKNNRDFHNLSMDYHNLGMD